MSSQCVWLDRQAITSHLCLPMTTKPKKIKIKKQIILFILDLIQYFSTKPREAGMNVSEITFFCVRWDVKP